MKQEVKTDRLLLKKTIYAKRHKTTREQVIAVLGLEVETPLRKHPDLEFVDFGEVVKSADQSHTWPLVFKLKTILPSPETTPL